jgi:GxxExxY protein
LNHLHILIFSALKMVCSICKKDGHTKKTCPGVVVEPVEYESASSYIDEDEMAKMEELMELLMEVATTLRKGRSESVYQNAILLELQEKGVKYTTEETIPILYKGKFVGIERIDIAFQSWLPLIIELKAVSTDVKPEHFWQVLSYMRTKETKFGMVVNFNQSLTKDLEMEFVFLHKDQPYRVNLVEDTLMPIQDYDYTQVEKN